MLNEYRFVCFCSIVFYLFSRESASVSLSEPKKWLLLIASSDQIVNPSMPIGSNITKLTAFTGSKVSSITPMYSLMQNYSDSSYFTLDPHNGILSTNRDIDRPAGSSYIIGVTISVGNYTEDFLNLSVLVKSSSTTKFNSNTTESPITKGNLSVIVEPPVTSAIPGNKSVISHAPEIASENWTPEEDLFSTSHCWKKLNDPSADFISCHVQRLKNISELLSNVSAEIKPKLITKVVDVLKSVANDSFKNSNVSNYMFDVIDNLLNRTSYVDQNSSQFVLEFIDNYTMNAATPSEGPLRINKSNIDLYLTNISANDVPEQGIQYTSPYSTKQTDVLDGNFTSHIEVAIIPKSVFDGIKCSPCRLSFINFKNRLLHQKSTHTKFNYSDISPLLSIEISQHSVDNLSVPIVYRVNQNSNYNYTCVYWDEIGRNWFERGLTTSITGNFVTCESHHLTYFSVLLDPTGGDFKNKNNLLDLLSIFGSLLSIVGLVLTIITYGIFWSNFQPQLRFVVINLSFSLLFMNASFVLVSLYNSWFDDKVPICTLLITCLQYFVLTSLSWMLVEAWNMYQMLVIIFAFPDKYYSLFRIILCWGAPLVMRITTNVYIRYYQNEHRCIWSENHYLVYLLTYYIPSVGIVIANIVLLANIFLILCAKRSITRHRPQNVNRRRSTLIQVCGYVSVITLTGITWIFSILIIGEIRPIFQYVFAITNSLQGFIIFVTKCIFHSTARKCWVKYISNKFRWNHAQQPFFSSTAFTLSRSSGQNVELKVMSDKAKKGLRVGHKKDTRKSLPENFDECDTSTN